ncbi:MAG: nascent polypeptide-associated complex protein [Thermoplasmata archaeon]
MMPSGNSRQMKRMMKKMGMKSEELDAKKVIIETEDKRLVFEDAQVINMKVQGQNMYQIIGDPREEAPEGKVLIPDEDIKMVAERAGVSEEEAKKALEDSNGEPAEAIINLST